MNIQLSSRVLPSVKLRERGVDELWNDFVDAPACIFGSHWSVSSEFVHLNSFAVCVGFSVTLPHIVLGTQQVKLLLLDYS